MFYALLLVTTALALVTSLFVATLFRGPVTNLLGRLLDEEVAETWGRSVYFFLTIVGLAGGVPLYDLERMAGGGSARRLELTSELWVLTVFESVIATLGSLAGALTLFFVVAVIAYAIVRRGARRHAPARTEDDPDAP